MNEKKLSELQKEYRNFFLQKLRLYEVNSPAELSKEKKSQFFTEIKTDWGLHKLLRQQKIETCETNNILEEPRQTYREGSAKSIDVEENYKVQNWPLKEYPTQSNGESQRQHSERKVPGLILESSIPNKNKQIVKSKPNPGQTDDLRIGFQPNAEFAQKDPYQYPVVKMPKENCSLKLPRFGRSNQKGYKEIDFYTKLKQSIPDTEIENDVHLVIPNFSKPYEPDIVLFSKSLNLYIDIEIDEPYDGYYRYPTHYINPEDEVKQDDIRDLFFTESGWIVIRFTEKQVHCQASQCIDYIKNVISSICNRAFNSEVKCDMEGQWDYNQCIQWQKSYYRENYLGIDRFQKQHSYKEIEIDTAENESIEQIIKRTKKFSFDDWSSSIAFDEESHKYIHPKDETGNAELISVTTLIERFFPFDLKRYIERKAEEENRTEEDVLDEYLIIRDEAAEKGTALHKQIENYLKKSEFDLESKEFNLFLDFYNKEIKERNLVFFDAEKIIFFE